MADKDTNEEALSQPEEGVDANVSDDQATSDPSDKMSPDHPRFKEVYNDMKTYKAESEQLQSELKDLKQEMEEIRSQAQERGQQGGDTEFTQEELQAIEKIDKALKKRGYVTNEQLNEKESILNRRMEFERLSQKYSGKDGYPKFDSEEVNAYAKKNGFGNNYEAAYNDLHRDAIIRVEAKKLNQDPKVPTSESPASQGERSITQEGLTPEQVANMSDEEYEKNREKILQGLKQTSA